MQPLERPTKLSGRVDRIGLRLLILLLCIAWFYLLWKRLLPALLAGTALSILWYYAIHLGEKRTLATREKSLREKIGGQLAVDSLLLQNAQSAASNVATWLSTCLPLTDFTQIPGGVLAQSEGKTVFITCLRIHPASCASQNDILHALRSAIEHNAEICVLCATSPFSPAAILYAEELQPRTRLLGREGLMRIAGTVAPATNQQLQELGKTQRKKRFDPAQWKALLLQPAKAKRYGTYGLGMLTLLIFTRQWAYLVPATACLGLFFMSRRKPGEPFDL